MFIVGTSIVKDIRMKKVNSQFHTFLYLDEKLLEWFGILFSKCLSTKKLPKVWKMAKLIAAIKSNKPADAKHSKHGIETLVRNDLPAILVKPRKKDSETPFLPPPLYQHPAIYSGNVNCHHTF